MGDECPDIARVRHLLESQRLAVLATQGETGPYGSLVAFAATSDFGALLFATARATRKFANLERSDRAALVVDSRSNREEDFHRAAAATLIGRTSEVTGRDRALMAELYLAKHPHLREFLRSPTCALFRFEIEACYVVSRFQTVMELEMTP